MKTVIERIDVYTYDELEQDGKDKAINDLIEVWMECEPFIPLDAIDGYNRAWESAEQMQTPWFWGSYIWEYCEEQVLEECRSAYFLKNGKWYGYKDEVDNENQA